SRAPSGTARTGRAAAPGCPAPGRRTRRRPRARTSASGSSVRKHCTSERVGERPILRSVQADGTLRGMTSRFFSPLLWVSAAGLLTLVTLAAPGGCSSTPPNGGALCIADGGGCDPGLFCDTQIDGGYCTAPCSVQGSTDGCPEQSVCASISGGSGTECA